MSTRSTPHRFVWLNRGPSPPHPAHFLPPINRVTSYKLCTSPSCSVIPLLSPSPDFDPSSTSTEAVDMPPYLSGSIFNTHASTLLLSFSDVAPLACRGRLLFGTCSTASLQAEERSVVLAFLPSSWLMSRDRVSFVHKPRAASLFFCG